MYPAVFVLIVAVSLFFQKQAVGFLVACILGLGVTKSVVVIGFG